VVVVVLVLAAVAADTAAVAAETAAEAVVVMLSVARGKSRFRCPSFGTRLGLSIRYA
jgi:hypothetical protein